MKKAAFLIIFLSMAIHSGFCADVPAEKTRNVTDMLGRSVTIPAKVTRVVGVNAGALRLIVYLECTNLVVGVEDVERQKGRPYAFANPRLADLPRIGPMFGGNAELILAQSPDVIFCTYTIPENVAKLQEKTGIPVVFVEYGDLGKSRKAFHDALRFIASIMGKEKRAEALIGYIDKAIADLDRRTAKIPMAKKPSCYIGGIGYYGIQGILSTEPAYSPFVFTNTRNVAAGIGIEHALIDKEKLLEWDPDVIFIDEGGYASALNDLKDSSCALLRAKTNGLVHGVLPYNWYTTNYETVLADAYYVGSVLYPDAFKDVNPEKKADEIFSMMVGAPVYAEMKKMYGGFARITD